MFERSPLLSFNPEPTATASREPYTTLFVTARPINR
jgi:hypothetical protein